MTKSIILFEKEKDSLKERFYLLMNLIVTNRTKTLFESYLFVMIFFIIHQFFIQHQFKN
jgi:hypothetical protein